ncbi:hypothetical protein ACOSQ4_001076 [Xanthoceras sorbifolium]
MKRCTDFKDIMLSQPTHDWKFETGATEEESHFSRYVCSETGQHFYTYNGMMRYVNYARESQLPVYVPSFDFGKDDKKNLDDISPEDVLNSVKVMDLDKCLEKNSTFNGNDEAPPLETTGPKMLFSAKPKIRKSIKKRHSRSKKN